MSTNRERFLKLHGLPKDTSLSLTEISKLSDIPEEALQKVYNRGTGAWRTNIRSVRLRPASGFGPAFKKDVDAPRSAKLTKEQWSMARVYAFVMKTRKVFHGADKDIAVEFNLL
jgi:hypothetical protein